MYYGRSQLSRSNDGPEPSPLFAITDETDARSEQSIVLRNTHVRMYFFSDGQQRNSGSKSEICSHYVGMGGFRVVQHAAMGHDTTDKCPSGEFVGATKFQATALALGGGYWMELRDGLYEKGRLFRINPYERSGIQILGGCFSYIPETKVNLPYCRAGAVEEEEKIVSRSGRHGWQIGGGGRVMKWRRPPGFQRDIVLSI
ncbi:hypothetical protein F5141DRAFT_1066722 [Pisolithus sp. B1]|nr:hypothetical protein F5141DRAFT_1066722 [Pisolithus sp. B1]